jgi:DNA/RNA-binding domain of Phe-tRNA-synthetase-like protein
VIELSIDRALKECVPAISIGLLSACVTVSESNADLVSDITRFISETRASLDLSKISAIQQFHDLRKMYRDLGKDPTRYRSAPEALYRRILRGDGFPHVNTLVDASNFLSIKMLRAIGTYDRATLKAPLLFKIGQPGDTFQNLKGGLTNGDRLPLLCDDIGPFGSPSVDSERSKVELTTQTILMVMLSVSGSENLLACIEDANTLFQRYGILSTPDVEITIVE